MNYRPIIVGTTLALGVLLAFMVSLTAFAQQDPDDEETRVEQAKAQAAENEPAKALEVDRVPVIPPGFAGTSPAAVDFPLFAGLDDITVPAFRIDPATNQFSSVFDGVEVWGAAYDYNNDQVYVSDAVDLYVWAVGSPAPIFMSTISDTTGTNVSMEGLAYFDGTLYASKVGSTGEGEGIYTVDLNNFQATRVITYTDSSQTTISGLDADPATGQLYGTNDNSALRGLVQIDMDGTVTVITPYVGAETDIDGLAVGGGRAYLIADDQTPPWFEVWDFGTASWTTPVSTPFTTTEVFAGGAWIFSVDIGITPTSLSATVSVNDVQTQTLTIANTGSSTLNWSIFEDNSPPLIPEAAACDAPGDVPWLSVSPTLGSTAATSSDEVTVTFDSAGLAEGTYNASLCVESNDPGEPLIPVPVTLAVRDVNIGIIPTSLSATVAVNDVRTQTLTIANTGSSTLNWSIFEDNSPALIPEAAACDAPGDVPWLSVSPTLGSTAASSSDEVTVTFDSTGLAEGTYNASLCVESNDPVEPLIPVPVTLNVLEYKIYLPFIRIQRSF